MKSPDYNQIKHKELKNYALNILKEQYPGTIILEEKIEQVSKLIGNNDKDFFWKSFIQVVHHINKNLDEVCEELYSNDTRTSLNLNLNSNNQIENLLHPFTFNQNDIATNSGIGTSRFSRVLSKGINYFYPHEVYGMSIAFNIPASTLFDYFQDENKKKLVLKLDFVDDSKNEE